MPVLTVYDNGLTMGTPPGRNDHVRGKRDIVQGWTNTSTRSNQKFLYSVIAGRLTGQGFGVTLTLRDCPPNHDDWQKLRRAFVERLRRLGLIRLHWLTEWQRRGVPHLHAAMWFDESHERHELDNRIVGNWLDLTTTPYGAGGRGQRVTPISNAVGWFQYLSKHAVRGLNHYQRSPENIPSGWHKTGRIWGHMGDWPIGAPIRYNLDEQGGYRFRRIVRAWRLADARSEREPFTRRKRITSARRMLQHTDQAVCALRGVSEWISRPQADLVVLVLAAQGIPVYCELGTGTE